MRKTPLSLMLCLGLMLAIPAWGAAAANPQGQQDDSVRSEDHGHGDHRHGHGHGQGHSEHGHHHPQLDWSAYPAEFQVFKTQLDQLKAQQKGLFEQFKTQREQIRAAHDKLSEAKRKSLKNDLKESVEKLKATRVEIRKLSEQKRTAWEQFAQHSAAKQWDAAKVDMQTVIAKKQEMIVKQKQMLDAQKKVLERLQR